MSDQVAHEYLGITSTYSLNFEGIVRHILNQTEANNSEGLKRWAESFRNMWNVPNAMDNGLKRNRFAS
jgi:hypothetical protein